MGEVIQGILLKEVGAGFKSYLLVTAANFWNLERDHELSLIIVCELNPEEPIQVEKGLRWFRFDQDFEGEMPPHHCLIHQTVRRFFDFRGLLYPELRERFDILHSVVESDTRS